MKYRNAIQSLWDGLCDVYIRETVINPDNGRDEPVEVLKLQNQPCRLSFSNIAGTNEESSAALVRQTTKLFIAKDVEIPPGSKLIITQEEKSEAYQMSGKPAVYSCHQEIMLELFKEWA